MTELTIRGEKELLRKLSKLQPRKQKVAMKAMGLHLVGKMKVYPPRSHFGASGTKNPYKRTRNLAKRWDTKAKQDFVLVKNPTEYGTYVQGQNQFHFHRATGWKTLKDTAQKNMDKHT